MKLCSFKNCTRPLLAGGLCAGHRAQTQKGRPLSPLHPYRKKGNTPRITCDEVPGPLSTPCHVFRGGATPSGYGKCGLNGRTITVHIYIWTMEKGRVPRGKLLDHVCRVRKCCNQDHLRHITPRQNVTQNPVRPPLKTHCAKGHPFDAKNTKIGTEGNRRCRTCRRLRYARHTK